MSAETAGPRIAVSRHAPAGSVRAVLSQVTGWLLPGEQEIDPLRNDREAEALVRLATQEKVLGPLLVTVDAGALRLADHLVDRVVAGHEGTMLWCMHLEHRLLEVKAWFEVAGGIDFVVLKGSAVAHLDEPDPSLRSFADLDLLIAADHMDRAIAVLEGHGAVRRQPQQRPGFDRRFAKGVGLACPDGVEIDVHRTLTGRAHGFRIPLDELFAEPDPFTVGGEQFSALSRSHRALHAAYHAVAGSPTPPLRTLRDLAGYLSSPELGPEVVAPIAERWRGTAVLAEAVQATLDAFTFDAGAWTDWLAAVEVDPAETALLERGRHPIRWPIEWTTVRELGWRDRAAFVWAVAVPSAEVLAARHQTPVGRLASGLGRVRSGRAGRVRVW